MAIEAITTLRVDEFPNLLYVLIRDSDGAQGLGETFFGPRAVEAYIHETAAPILLGRDPFQIEDITRSLTGYLGFTGGGVENRGNSALDIGLWDLMGKLSGRPIHELLGGKVRDTARVYNTCAGYEYVRESVGQVTDNWGLPADDQSVRPYEDLHGFLTRADEVAVSLLDMGITAMKIWPFDVYAESNEGNYITNAQIDAGLEPFRKIRSAVGSAMDIMVEFHGLWNYPSALRICSALEDFQPFWYEDPIRSDGVESLTTLANKVQTPVTLSETLAGATTFRRMLASEAPGIAMLDVGWVGGITEARRIATIADTFQRPVAPHDCTGPVVLTASTHLSVSLPNAMIQETVRAFYTTWYLDLVTEIPTIADGRIVPPAGPGLGLELKPEVLGRADVHTVTSDRVGR